ncbi:glycosyltransferase [Niabella insulamsoli]|uniref:glycosyltransferase n=1 Tax=Niabella insulamsoli TaxID=3144874 RepID=UPI0031FCB972
MIKNKDIIIVGQQPWDTEIGSNCKDIALEFSKYNRVLYVNSPLDRISKLRGKGDPKVDKRINVIKGKEPGIVKINDNLFNLYPDCLVESINWIPNTSLFKIFNRVNNKRFAGSILKAIDELSFKDYILFNDNEVFKAFYLKDFLKPLLSIYYSRDNIVGVRYWKKHGATLEPELMAKSDLCLANSEYLKNYCKENNPHSFKVGQGCDFTFFTAENAAVRPEMEAIKKPIIGYVGALWTSRLDLPLLEHLAEKRPDWNFVYVGPEDERFENSKLHQMPNVFMLGPRHPEDLASYIMYFDVCMNPQYINPITIGNYPRKVDEYLALGKATIVTQTEPMLDFKEYILLAKNEQEYLDGIQHLLETDSPGLQEERRKFALSHSWENSITLMSQACAEVAAKQNKPF